MSVILFEDENLSIFYYEDRDYLLLKWNGFIAGETFRALGNEILGAIDKVKTQRVLSDNTNWKTIVPNDLGWAANTWFPEAEKRGVKLLATVLSADYFNRAAERTIEGLADVEEMLIRNFVSGEEALSWLLRDKVIERFGSAHFS